MKILNDKIILLSDNPFLYVLMYHIGHRLLSHQLCGRSILSSLDGSIVSVFDFVFSLLIRISCLTVLSSLKLTDVLQLVVSIRDCRRFRFLMIDRIRWKLLSSLDPSPTSCKAHNDMISDYYTYMSEKKIHNLKIVCHEMF